MAKITTVQAAFSGGEVGDGFEGRIDLDAYYKSVRAARNCYIDNLGYATRREGSEYIDATTTNQEARLISFSFNTVQTYLIVFTPGEFKVYKDGVLQATVTSSPIDALTADQIAGMDYVQSADTLIITHEGFNPIRITRTSDTSWAAEDISFSNIPQRQFIDTVGVGTDEVMKLEWQRSELEGSFRMRLEGELTDTIHLENSFTASEVETRIQSALRNLTITSETGITVSATLGGADGDGEATITFGGDDGERNWITPAFEDKSSFRALSIASTTQGEPPQEDVWSATRGWPKSATFFEGRLWFGGSTDAPQTIWGSLVNSFFDFNLGTGLDDQALDITIDDDQVNAITSIIGGRTLQIFTSGGEFAILKNIDSAITPGNILIRKQTSHGTKAVRPISIDGSTVFIENSGTVVREFLFNDVENSYTAPNVTVLSPEVTTNVKRMATRKSTSTSANSITYMVNEDGTCAVLNKLREQNLRAFSVFETIGSYEDVTVVGDDVYFVVKRTINGATVRFIEKLNREHLLDASSVQSSGGGTDTWTSLDHLDDEEVTILVATSTGDNLSTHQALTPSSGSVTTDYDVNEFEAGLSFFAKLELLPIEALLGRTQTAGSYKRAVFANVRVLDTRTLKLTVGRSSYKPSFRNHGSLLLDQPTPSYTGWKKIYVGGINRDSEFIITQEEPLEWTVLSAVIGVSL